MLTIETKQEYDCIISMGMSKWPKRAGFYFTWPIFKKKIAYPTRAFAVAASRIGNLKQPRWCYSNQVMNVTALAKTDSVTGNGDPSAYAILVDFTSGPTMMAYTQVFGQFACEAWLKTNAFSAIGNTLDFLISIFFHVNTFLSINKYFYWFNFYL